jgi:glutamine amidotransferase
MGDTDSEVVFFVFLSELSRAAGAGRRAELSHAMAALRTTVKRVRELCDGRPGVDKSLLTLLATDGENLVATHGGKELYFSTYKTRCSDREHCPSLSASCEAPSVSGVVNHFIVSSEPLQGENVWLPLEPGDIVGVDRHMQISKTHLDRTPLPVAS